MQFQHFVIAAASAAVEGAVVDVPSSRGLVVVVSSSSSSSSSSQQDQQRQQPRLYTPADRPLWGLQLLSRLETFINRQPQGAWSSCTGSWLHWQQQKPQHNRCAAVQSEVPAQHVLPRMCGHWLAAQPRPCCGSSIAFHQPTGSCSVCHLQAWQSSTCQHNPANEAVAAVELSCWWFACV
jgi:hypothetical protein